MRILIDGPDGVGKTTLVRRLADHYSMGGQRTTLTVSDPNHALGTVIPASGGTPVSLREIIMNPVSLGVAGLQRSRHQNWSQVAQCLEDPLPQEVSQLLILAGELWTDRIVTEQETIAKRDGVPIMTFFDRWVTSTIVYQALSASPDRRDRLVQDVVELYMSRCSARFDITFIVVPNDPDTADKVFQRTRERRDADVFNVDDVEAARSIFHRRVFGFSTLIQSIRQAGLHPNVTERFMKMLGTRYTLDASMSAEELFATAVARISAKVADVGSTKETA